MLLVTCFAVDDDGSRSIYMTPLDFIRAITPGMMQPQEYGLDLYRTVAIEVDGLSIFCHVDCCRTRNVKVGTIICCCACSIVREINLVQN